MQNKWTMCVLRKTQYLTRTGHSFYDSLVACYLFTSSSCELSTALQGCDLPLQVRTEYAVQQLHSLL